MTTTYPPDKETATPLLGDRFTAAFELAASLHRHQIRKGSEVPYLAHLMAVASMVLEHGADEDVAIAALLHDAVEDQGGLPVLDGIRVRFGERVAAIVLACSDSTEPKGTHKPPWRERKERYLAHLAHTTPEARMVSLADKLHNCRATVADLRHLGLATFDRFNAGADDIVWFYRAFCEAAREHGDSPLVRELDLVVSELERLARG